MGAGLVTIFCPRMGHSKRNSDLSFKNRKRREKRGKRKNCNYLDRLPSDQADGRLCRVHWCDSTSLEAVHTGTWRLFSWLQVPPSSLLLLPLLFFLLSMLLSVSLVCRRPGFLRSWSRYKIRFALERFRFHVNFLLTGRHCVPPHSRA